MDAQASAMSGRLIEMGETTMFFDSGYDLLRVVLVGTLAYLGCVVLMRISGNRTLSKMNSFDLVVTVAFGSTLSSILVT
ncbi:MAG: hypothetical protein EOP50_20525, partial [Sphingobacteriales bacterium]